MTTTLERAGQRVRAAMVYLAEHDEAVHKQTLLDHLAEVIPAEESDHFPTYFYWDTLGAVKAGWLLKNGRGFWSITDAGRDALVEFTDPVEFLAEARRKYQAWDTERKTKVRRAWMVRGASVLGANMVGEWLDGGFVSIAASQLGALDHDVTAEDLTAIVQESYSHLKHSELQWKIDEVLKFVIKIKPNDLVITTSDQSVYVGDITGDWQIVTSSGSRSNLRRQVEWRNPDAPIPFDSLPPALSAKMSSGNNIVDLTSQAAIIDDLTTPGAPDTTDPSDETVDEMRVHEDLPDPSEQLSDELFVDPGWLTKVQDLLNERKQVIFYGPPGTGKTYIARKLAADLVGGEQVKLIQLHPAYTYEDFFEGYRPTGGDGASIGFERKAGPLKQLVARAEEHRDQAFVLIIDEINRANLAKVFGELYFLLEYRDQAVDLLYSADDGPFTLPPNIYLIGTMNTADRSIAMVDSAIRRRFAFIGLHPGIEPTKSLLRRWSEHHGLPPVAADLLEQLNATIDDLDFQIGPSYFMRRTDPDAFSRRRLELIWEADILPLLEEHFYGQWDRQAGRFRLATLLQLVSPSPSSPDDAVHSSEPPQPPT